MKKFKCKHVLQTGQVCGHVWIPRLEKPKKCPKCFSPNWEK